MTMIQEQPTNTHATRVGIIDCDVHPMPRGEVTIEANEDASVEAYPVTIEDGLIVLHV